MEHIHETVGDRPVFVSFDIGFIDPAYAPGTGMPEVGGLQVLSVSIRSMLRGSEY